MSRFIQSVKNEFDKCDIDIRDIAEETVVMRRCLNLQYDYSKLYTLFTCSADYDEDDRPYVELFYDPPFFQADREMEYTIFIDSSGLFIRKDDHMHPIDSIRPVVVHARHLCDESYELHSMFESQQVPRSFFS